MTTTQSYDAINRLTDVAAALPASPLTSAHYRYNAANQRDRLTLADRSYWAYEYDILGQVRAGKKHWPDDALVPGQQFEYTHDDIGNRTGPNGTKMGGDQSGGGLRSASYTPNALNQYSSRTVPNQLDVMGIANASANVTLTVNINGQNAAAYRHNEYFQAAGTADNAYGPAWVPVTVSATRNGQTVQQPSTPPGHLLVAPATQSFGYDGDGNMLSDGLWNYTWDAENRLIAMDGLVSGPTARHLTFEYDCQGRRMTKVVKDTGWNTLTDTRFLYEGWNLVAEVNAQRTLVRSYLWGLDLSGAFQGAGGVGGLLAVTDAAQGAHFVAYDGNGNIMALVKASEGSIGAQYEYGPFGETIRATGPMAKTNPLRFSSKYTDDETDFVYYGYPYYSPSLGRRISRDPIEEKGGLNVYDFVDNDSISAIDVDGLQLLPVRIPLPVRPPIGPNPVRPIAPFLPLLPSKPDDPSLRNPSVIWQDAPVEVEKIRTGCTDEARNACRALALKKPGHNQYFCAKPSYNRAMGAAAVLWDKDPQPKARWSPPGYMAANVHRFESVEKGHLLPRVYGGTRDSRNIVTMDTRYNRGTYRTLTDITFERLLTVGDNPFIGVVVLPKYRCGKPVPRSFQITIVHRDGYFDRTPSDQPDIYGDQEYLNYPFRSKGLGILNEIILQAGP